MKSLLKGVVLGTIVGSVSGLLTAKRSGQQTQAKIADYFNGVASASQEVSHSLKRVQGSLHTLTTDGMTLAQEAKKDFEKLFSDYDFQATPRIKQINEQIEKIQSEAGDLVEIVPKAE